MFNWIWIASVLGVTQTHQLDLKYKDTILFKRHGQNIMYHVANPETDFWCTTYGLPNYQHHWGRFLTDVASHTQEPDQDFGLIIRGFYNDNAHFEPGYCNASVSTHDGLVFLTFLHHTSCVGYGFDTHCDLEAVVVIATAEETLSIAREFDIHHWEN